METFNPKTHRIALNMYQHEMAYYMGWSLRKQQMLEDGTAELTLSEYMKMKLAKKMKKTAKKARYPVDRCK